MTWLFTKCMKIICSEIKLILTHEASEPNWRYCAGLNASTTPITAMGCQQCLSLSVVQLKGKHCPNPHFHNGVVDTLCTKFYNNCNYHQFSKFFNFTAKCKNMFFLYSYEAESRQLAQQHFFEIVVLTKERSSERVDYDQFLPRNGLFGSLQRFLKH